MTRRAAGLAGLAAALAGRASAQAVPPPLDEAAVRRLVADWVDVRRQSVGMAVALVGPDGTRFVSHGFRRAGGAPVDPDTVFGLASLSKTFTGLLLAEAVRRGEVALDDPLSRHLPEVAIPQRGGRRIRLIDLAHHTSGLPHELPDVVAAAKLSRASADPMTPLYEHLKTATLGRDIGETWGYSNLGYALLGEALARRAGMSFEALVQSRITGPLGMSRTGITFTPAMEANRARPHDASLAPAAEVDKPWSGGAGLLRSSARDMAVYVSAYLALAPSPLGPAMADVLEPRVPAPFVSAEQALGWLVYPGPRPLVFFAGATTGFCTGAAFDPVTRHGVVVLSNAAELVDGFARHLLRPSLPLPPPAPKGEFAGTTPVAPFLGDYRLAGALGPRLPAGMVLAVRQDTTGLNLQIPGAPKAPLTRESETRFAVRGFGLAVDFTPDPTASPRLRLTLGPDTTVAERVR